MSEMYFTGANSMFEPVSHIKMYSDSTPMVKMPGWSRVVERADTLTIRGGGMANFVTGMMLVDAVTRAGGEINNIVIPYLPGARQDRTNPTGDVLQTARFVGMLLAEQVPDRVVFLDPHSEVIVGSMKSPYVETVEFPLAEVVKMIPNVYDGVIAADKGGKDRAEQFAKAMNLPVFYGGKTRDVSTGKLNGFELEHLKYSSCLPGHFLVVDDICDGGGTFNGLAGKIHEQGATADLYVSHGLFSKGTKALKENFNNIFTTDSLPTQDGADVTVLPVVKAMEQYVN